MDSRGSRGSADSIKLLGGPARPVTSGGVRELTEAEVAIKRTQAADWFKQAGNINAAQGKTLEDRMEAFRVRRTERTTSKDGSKEAASSDGSKEIPRGYKQGTPRSPVSQDASSAGGSTTAGTKPSQSASSGSADAAATKPAESEPKKPSLMEKFGYGVKPKQEPKPEAMDMRSFTKKKTVMVEVRAGENDLLERLRRGSRTNTVP
jgi:hypothetical protein